MAHTLYIYAVDQRSLPRISLRGPEICDPNTRRSVYDRRHPQLMNLSHASELRVVDVPCWQLEPTPSQHVSSSVRLQSKVRALREKWEAAESRVTVHGNGETLGRQAQHPGSSLSFLQPVLAERATVPVQYTHGPARTDIGSTFMPQVYPLHIVYVLFLRNVVYCAVL